MKNLVTVINENKDTMKFTEHFKTKNSIKNLLKGFPNPKVLSQVFDNKEFSDSLLSYEDVSERFISIVSDSMNLYTGQYNEWRSNGSVPGLPHRVNFFMGIVDDVMCKDAKIADTLADFAKTDDGKEIEKIVIDAVKDSDKKSDDVLMDILVSMAVRETINRALQPEEVKPETDEEAKPEETKTETTEEPKVDDVKVSVEKLETMMNNIENFFGSLDDSKISDDFKNVLLKISDPNVSPDDAIKLINNTLNPIYSEIVKIAKSEHETSNPNFILVDDVDVIDKNGNVISDGSSSSTYRKIFTNNKFYTKSAKTKRVESANRVEPKLKDAGKTTKKESSNTKVFDINEFLNMCKSFDINTPAERIDYISSMIHSQILKNRNQFVSAVNNMVLTNKSSDNMKLLPLDHAETINGYKIANIMNFINAIVYNKKTTDEDEIKCMNAISIYLTYLAFDAAYYTRSSKVFNKFAALFIKVIGTPNFMEKGVREKLLKSMTDIEDLVKRVNRYLKKTDTSTKGLDVDIKYAGAGATHAVSQMKFKQIYKWVRSYAA